MSFFILPYVVAAVLWLRDRDEWKSFVRLFVGLSFAALVIYALMPAAPPWAAARCTAADVEGGPAGPGCMFRSARGVPDGGLLGAMQTTQDGANDWIERIVGRGWGKLNLHSATRADRPGSGQREPCRGDPVAARRVVARDRDVPVEPGGTRLATGPRRSMSAIMAFTLVYTAEHYVIDILLGWVLAVVVVAALRRYEARRQQQPTRAR